MTTNLQTHYWIAIATNTVPFTNATSTSAGEPQFVRTELR